MSTRKCVGVLLMQEWKREKYRFSTNCISALLDEGIVCQYERTRGGRKIEHQASLD